MVDEQAHVMLGPNETRLGEVRLAQRSMRDARRIDGVGLAVGARRGTCSGHHLGRYADHALTTGEQVALKPARDVATVLDGEEARGAESARPGQQLVMPARIAADRLLGEAPSARRVQRHRDVGLHVRVDSDYDHAQSPFVGCSRFKRGPPADTP